MRGFAVYMARRLGVSLISLLGVALLVVVFMQLLPGDPARVIAGLLASEESVEQIRDKFGFDEPLPVQFGLFVSRAAKGELGVSARTGRPVLEEIFARLPATLVLAGLGTVIGAVAGIALGVFAALKRGTIIDHVLSAVAVMGVSMPVYWLGILLILLFAVNLGWFPAAGAEKPTSLILPSVTLGVFSMALIARMTRGTMLEVLQQDYVRTARAKGADEKRVTLKHALRNAFIPVLTVIGLQFGGLLGGAVLTESVFSWPGIGRLLVDSIFARDYPVVQGVIFVYAVLLIVLNIVVDLLYTVVDPRVRYYG